VFTVSGLTKVGEHEIVSAESAEIEDSVEEAPEDAISGSDADKLIERIKSVLGDRVENVILSKRLVDSAATLVAGSQGMDAQMERMMRLMDESYAGSKKVLEINPNHALIRNLSVLRQDAAQSDLVEKAINQIYDGALLIEGMLESPNDFVDRMTALMVSATDTGE